MLKTDVFVWLTVNCKSLNFFSVDTLSAQLHCHMDYFIYWHHANSTHLPYSIFACNFEFSSLVIHKVTKLYNSTVFKFYLAKKWGHGPLLPHPRVCYPFGIKNAQESSLQDVITEKLNAFNEELLTEIKLLIKSETDKALKKQKEEFAATELRKGITKLGYEKIIRNDMASASV